MSHKNHITAIQSGAYNALFSKLYGSESLEFHQERWTSLIQNHEQRTGDDSPRLFSASGRTELAGNHTDHNRGRVLAATVQLDTIAAVTQTDDSVVEILSKGYPPVRVDLAHLEKIADEAGRTDALVRGIANAIVRRGGSVGGFTASTTSRVLGGSGLSSSAALEVLVGSIFSTLFNENRFSPVELAIMGQEAENVYFEKPCGLMDQVACAHGGAVAIDFADEDHPQVTPVAADFQKAGYALAVVNTGGDHADLTADYAAIPAEMKAAAAQMGGKVLGEVNPAGLKNAIPAIRNAAGDRAVLRAKHFFEENLRVSQMTEALREGNIDVYLNGARSSGDSSYRFLQNVSSPRHPQNQEVALGLALTEEFLEGEGACRVHGGGFAGTVQVFIPLDKLEDYIACMEPVFGQGCVVPLSVRSLPVGELLL